MTLKDLILKYDFDTIVPDLLTVDKPTIFLNAAVQRIFPAYPDPAY